MDLNNFSQIFPYLELQVCDTVDSDVGKEKVVDWVDSGSSNGRASD